MLHNLRKMLAHPIVFQSNLWGSVYIAVAAVATALDPQNFPPRTLVAGSLAMAASMLGGTVTARFLINGSWSLPRWRGWFIACSTIPWTVGCAIWAIGAPRYSGFGFLLGPIGAIMGLGIFRVRSMAAFGLFFLFCLGLLNHLYPAFTVTPPFALAIGGAVLSYYLLLGSQSSYWLDREADRGSLLRESRRNKRIISEEREKSEKLLLNVLPADVAAELKEQGRTTPRRYESASVLFTDFKGFTIIAAQMDPEELIGELDRCFSYFDQVSERYGLEKLKTIGDSYMCAGGVPGANNTHAVDCVLAALEIQSFMARMQSIKTAQGLPYWELRLGIHTGPLVAGVIGEKKFAYDVWGDTVNVASRLESSSVPGKVNISAATHALVRDFFKCEYRGRVPAKHKGEVDMYFVESIAPGLHLPEEPQVPGPEWHARYARLGQQGPDQGRASRNPESSV